MEPTPWDADWRRYYKEADPIARDQYNIIIDAIGSDTLDSFNMETVFEK